MVSRATTRSTPGALRATPAKLRSSRSCVCTPRRWRSSRLGDLNPLIPVVTGPLSAAPFRSTDATTSAGTGSVEPCSSAGKPTRWRSHSISTPVASMTRQAAATTSGPMPSPGISVTRCELTRRPSASSTAILERHDCMSALETARVSALRPSTRALMQLYRRGELGRRLGARLDASRGGRTTRSLERREAARLKLGATFRESRACFYDAMWRKAAATVGAEVGPLGGEFLIIRRGGTRHAREPVARDARHTRHAGARARQAAGVHAASRSGFADCTVADVWAQRPLVGTGLPTRGSPTRRREADGNGRGERVHGRHRGR